MSGAYGCGWNTAVFDPDPAVLHVGARLRIVAATASQLAQLVGLDGLRAAAWSTPRMRAAFRPKI